ncbi:SDR family NAD(P)-dependent oxidoreductase, partial [Verrucomicrobia bacterium]|nr:SDR family NAD(P)-dependent oxidoreductase [Verrucomicrobiota bacterium]
RTLEKESAIKKGILENMKGKPDVKKLEKEYRRWMANREIRHNIERMEACGSKVFYRSVDIRDTRAVSKMVDKIRKDFGPVRGLIHGAGVLADRRIEDKTVEQFDLVFSTKVDGIQSLLKATKKDPLRIIVFFSSFTGRYGRKGQVDYAMANEVLNKLAHAESLKRTECRVISANWGPWNGGMVNDGLRKFFEAEGVGLIEPSAGAEYLVRELSQKVNRAAPVEVVVLAPAASNSQLTKAVIEPVPEVATAAKSVPVKPVEVTSWKTVIEREVSVSGLPCLKSHVIKGKAVLPAALMSELLAHGALHGNPGERLVGFQEFQVLKGLTLDAVQSATLFVESGDMVSGESSTVVPMRLVSQSDGKHISHAQGEIVLGKSGEGTPSILTTFGADDRGPSALYSPDSLFHLEHFQGILSMIGCDESGFAARVSTAPKPKNWIASPWRSKWTTDPLVIDCIYQLMIVWSRKHNHAPCLPSKVGFYEQFADFPKGEVEIRAQITKTARRVLIADVEILGPKGELVARMKGCQSTVAASLSAAFKENVLASA